jgi:hypothetical protein
MKKLATALGMVLILVGTMSVLLWRQLESERARNAETLAHVTTLESMPAVYAPATPNVAGAEAPVALSAATQSGTGPGTPTATGQSSARGANPLAAQIEQLRNSAEGREFQQVMMRRMLEEQYPDVAKELDLSPEKAGKLLDLLAKQRADLGSDLLSQQTGGAGDRAAREESARALARKEQAYEAELATLLGDSYKKFKEYQDEAASRQRAQYARQETESLRKAIDSGGAPLTDAQFQYLNSALASEQKRIEATSGGLNMQQQVQRMAEDNRRLVEVAAAHLNHRNSFCPRAPWMRTAMCSGRGRNSRSRRSASTHPAMRRRRNCLHCATISALRAMSSCRPPVTGRTTAPWWTPASLPRAGRVASRRCDAPSRMPTFSSCMPPACAVCASTS